MLLNDDLCAPMCTHK